MTRMFFGIFLSLMSLLTHAADASANVPAAAEVSAWPMIIFALVFVGMVGGFIIFIWLKGRARKGRDRRQRESEPS